MQIKYDWNFGSFAKSNVEFLSECAALYSTAYGKWAPDAPEGGGRNVRLSPSRIREWLESPDSKIMFARAGSLLIGYAIAIQTKVPYYGTVTWVTQLVVHADYRQRGVAKNLLFSLWTFSDHFAWGLVSANPFAVRALEKATRRRCKPSRITKHGSMLMKVGSDHLPYVYPFTETDIGETKSAINTEFKLDHSAIPSMIEQAIRSGIPWLLGELKAGWEWFAFTFQDQVQIDLTSQEIQEMIAASDEVVRQAYSRMTLDRNHSWTRHSSKEVEFIIRECRIVPGKSVLDLGCGTGRHSLQLAERGFRTTGVDYISQFIDAAKMAAGVGDPALATFLDADCRKLQLNATFDAVVCLYDVIGSFADKAENFKIMRTIAKHLKPGGYALISVMNGVLTRKIAKYRFSLKRDANQLLKLKPSRTMEKTGNIFDPEYFMLDEEAGIVYRKEQFESGTSLPAELIVRDRRYGPIEISAELSAVGLTVRWARCVRAGDWDVALDEEDERAKEILLLCSKA